MTLSSGAVTVVEKATLVSTGSSMPPSSSTWKRIWRERQRMFMAGEAGDLEAAEPDLLGGGGEKGRRDEGRERLREEGRKGRAGGKGRKGGRRRSQQLRPGRGGSTHREGG